MEDHTFEFLKSGEFREVKVSNTKNYDNWLNSGAPDVVQNAGRKVKELIKSGNDKLLDNKKIEAINRIIKDFEINSGGVDNE